MNKYLVTIDDDDPDVVDIFVEEDDPDYDGPEDNVEDGYGVYHITAESKEEAVEEAKFLHEDACIHTGVDDYD